MELVCDLSWTALLLLVNAPCNVRLLKIQPFDLFVSLSTCAILNLHMIFDMYVVCACNAGQLEMVKILLDAGANPNFGRKENKLSEMPINASTMNRESKPGSLEIMELLIAKGADVNCTNYRGLRALIFSL